MSKRRTPTLHTEHLKGRDIVTGQPLDYVVLWLDRDPICGRCGQDIGTGECPVTLSEGAGLGGELMEWSQQHGCGEWNRMDWVSAGEDPTQEELDAAVRELTGSA